MSITNGQLGNETNFNAAFVSKTATSSNNVDGKIDLTNSDTESGGSITNIQKRINQETRNVRAVQTITAAGIATVDERFTDQTILVVGDAGNVTISSTPVGSTGEQGGAFIDGTILTFMGTNDSQTVKFQNNDAVNGFIVNGDAELEKFSTVTFEFISSLSRWVERGRSL